MFMRRALCIAILFICIVEGGLLVGKGVPTLIRIVVRRAETNSEVVQLCPPAGWIDYISFYLGNYFAHVATVQTYPGESTWSTIQALGVALIFPAAGVSRGLTAIIRCAKWQNTPIQTAARAGALCMVVRTQSWQPSSRPQRIDGLIIRARLREVVKQRSRSEEKLRRLVKWLAIEKIIGQSENMEEDGMPYDNPSVSRQLRIYWPPWAQELSDKWEFYDTCGEHINPGQSVHGFCRLTDGYALAHVPRDCVVNPVNGIDPGQTIEVQYPTANTISDSYSFPKAFIAVVQLLYACFTLGRSFHGQISEYGYAAFGLTVTPYALMSLVNLVGGLVTPSYPTLFLVHSSIMDEARNRESVFDGVVGSLNEIPIPEVEGAELISGDFTSSAGGDHIGSTTRNVTPASIHFESPAAPRPNLTSIDILSYDSNDPYAACVFVPSSPNFQRQKFYSYQISRSSPRNTPSGNGYLNKDPVKVGVLENAGPVPLATIFVSALSIAIIGGMTGFHAQNSSVIQRLATMLWVTFGISFGSFLAYLFKIVPIDDQWGLWWLFLITELPLLVFLKIFRSHLSLVKIRQVEAVIEKIKYIRVEGSKLLLVVVYCAPSLLGFIVVGLMIKEFGVCPE